MGVKSLFLGKNKRPSRKPKDRLPFLFFMLVVFLFAIGGRLIFIQGVKAEKFDRLAKAQRLKKITLNPDRGAIFDRNGEILAISMEMNTIYATPYQVKRPHFAARAIARILGENEADIYKKITAESGFSYVKRKVGKKKADRIRRLKIEGIGLIPESKRFYPGRNLASRTIGFVGLDNTGLSGLELSFDTELKGREGELSMEQDIYGRPIPGGEFKLRAATAGDNIVLTIDKAIQYKAQVELKNAVKKWHASGGWIMVMDSRTGEVYALANEPTFNLNKFIKADPDLFANKIVSSVYEPGSVMKVVTAAGALEEKLYSPSSVFSLPGTMRIGGYTIHDSHPRGTELFTFTQIVTRSSNIGAVTIGMAMGKEKLSRYTEKFGLNSRTGIELFGEGQGYLPPIDQWSASTIGNVPFGQGLSSTALAIARAVNVIAAEGRLVNPGIIKSVIDSNGRSSAIKKSPEPKEIQVVSKATANTMARILKETVEVGTGRNAKISGFEVAGKTGTAQKPKIDARGYDPGKYVASFVGFVPVRKPALTILVAIDEPQDNIYGGVVAAPVFSAVGEYALQRLKVEP